MRTEEIIKLNNAKEVLERLEKEEMDPLFAIAIMTNGKYQDPIITDENIKNNSKFIVDLFDEPKQYIKK